MNDTNNYVTDNSLTGSYMPQNRLNEPVKEKIEESEIGKTKIININDFIFRQNIEFYPNLNGIKCRNNELTLTQNGEIVSKETLPFDLRTLPGDIWLLNPESFMKAIKTNKDCLRLYNFVTILEKNAYEAFILADMEQSINEYMNLYFKLKDSTSILADDNKGLISKLDTLIALLSKETALGKIVEKKLDEYYETTKELGDTKGKVMALELKKNEPSTYVEPEQPLAKAGFINVAILIYGLVNIGIILAIAFLK